jgi:outer membrane lipoprotein-sorting protein
MKKVLSVLAVAFILNMAAPLQADIKIKDIIDMLKMKIDRIKDIKVEIATSMIVKEKNLENKALFYGKGDLFRIELANKINNTKILIVGDGSSIWMINSENVKQKIDGFDLTKFQPDKLLIKYSDKATLSSEEKVNDVDCYVIEIKDIDMSKMSNNLKFWLNKKSLNIEKMTSENMAFLMETDFIEFTEVTKGIELPKKALIKSKMMEGVINYNDYAVNQGLSDDLFNIDLIVSTPAGK